eukprot:CAMPEP_0181428700 /NCGR_PEP_ID=MMETSP1110-20121109/16816_1 /TAXON_ID=174948 /ORGANISM="Symbiodinium sp., Strain CCMP421" /LENGTH=122 /DNA_ID=CAMNT_0023551939 /DNA_START=99 /DNA_END=464 /DNA_ORIENTATION=+
MSSTSRATLASAGAALLGGAAFVSTGPSRTGHLRATATAASASSPAPGLEAHNVAGLAVASAAAATCFASRKASATSARHQLVTLSAFENELGVQAPVGFWDPAGFTADGSTENFARRRQTE